MLIDDAKNIINELGKSHYKAIRYWEEHNITENKIFIQKKHNG